MCHAARLIGMPRRTFNVAMQRLQELQLMDIDGETLFPLPIVMVAVGENGDLLEEPFLAPEQGRDRAETGQRQGKADSDFPEKSTVSAATRLTPVTPIPSPSETAPSEATGRSDRPSAVKFTSEEWERFHQLIGLIVDYSSGKRDDEGDVIDPHKTGAGIIAVSGGEGHFAGGEVGDDVYGCPYDWAELQKFAHAGLLIRRGDRYYISTLGWQAHDWVEQRQQKEAA
jgi:hypothetical protein